MNSAARQTYTQQTYTQQTFTQQTCTQRTYYAQGDAHNCAQSYAYNCAQSYAQCYAPLGYAQQGGYAHGALRNLHPSWSAAAPASLPSASSSSSSSSSATAAPAVWAAGDGYTGVGVGGAPKAVGPRGGKRKRSPARPLPVACDRY